jgi:putative hemolysin
VFVPETLSGMELLEHFRGSDTELVFVVDEYGEVQGVITLRDVLEAITGEFSPHRRATPGPCSARTAAGCWTA